MAITCPQCGAGFDVTLFQFGHRVRCDCGAELAYPGKDALHGHRLSDRTQCPSLSAAQCPSLPAAQPREKSPMAEVELGRVTHYFGKIGVAGIEITQDSLAVGDTIHIKGHTSDFTQTIDSMQIDGQSVNEVTVGQSIGIKVTEHAREHDMVYKVLQ